MVPTQRSARRGWRWPAIILVSLAVLVTLLFVAALVIHFILLSTERFNWLEPAKT